METFKVTVCTAMVCAATAVLAWDVEHDEIARLTGEALPAEIRTFFSFEDFGVLTGNCHFPDMTESEPRRWRTVDDMARWVDAEDREILAKAGCRGYWLHTEEGKAVVLTLLSRAFATGAHTKAAFYLSLLTHSVSDESALNHPTLGNYHRYTKFAGVQYPSRKIEPGAKNVFGFRSDGPVAEKARERLAKRRSFRGTDASFDDALLRFAVEAVRQGAYSAEKEGAVFFAPLPEAMEALADLVAMQVDAIVDMAETAWRFRRADQPLPPPDFKQRSTKAAQKFVRTLDPFRESVWAGLADARLDPPAPKGVVGVVCEPYGVRGDSYMTYAGKVIAAASARTLRDNGYAIKALSFWQVDREKLPSPGAMPILLLVRGSWSLPDGVVKAVRAYLAAGGRLVLVGGSDPEDLTGFSRAFVKRGDKEVPASGRWAGANAGDWRKMSVYFDGKVYPQRQDANVDGYCKPRCLLSIDTKAPGVEPFAEFSAGETRFTVAARKGNVAWVPQYLLMPFLYTDETTADWAAQRLDAFGTRVLLKSIAGVEFASSGRRQVDVRPGASFTAETSNPLNNMFAIGKPATVTFRAAGWTAGESRDVTMEVFDHADALLEKRTVRLAAGPDGAGEVVVPLPTGRYGFFRVRARAGGLSLPKRGTRPAGQFTYGVAMAPADRPEIPQELAFQGVHGEACAESLWLGAHQGFASAFPSNEARTAWWRKNEEIYPPHWKKWGVITVNVGSSMLWAPDLLSARSRAWLKKNGTDWSIFKSPDGREVYRDWIERKTKRFREHSFTPGGTRIYSPFWEPDLTVPDKETLVDAARFVHELVKRYDPEGLVSVPTISNCTRLDWHRELFELGLLQYADVFELHPYTAYPPEPNGFLENIRALKRLLAEYGRPDMPMIGSESGYQTAATRDGELLQLEGQVRVHLILLGEGFWFNMPFYGTDYGGDRDDHPEGDYGLTYNLDYPHPRFGAKHISPRPSFCGISAFSMLLDGWKSSACLDYIGETVLGYAYTNQAGRTTLALWDFGGKPSSLTLPVGRTSIETADVMGNRTVRATDEGKLTLTLGTAPVYVIDPDWAALEKGLASFRQAAAEAARAQAAAPVKITAVSAAFAGDDPAADVTVLNNSGDARTLAVCTRIVGEPLARRSVSVPLAPRETRRVTVPLAGFRPDPFRTFELEASATDGDDNHAEKVGRMNFLRAAHEPDADRHLAGWAGVPRHKVPQDARAAEGNRTDGIADPADLAAEIGFGWNERALLIDARVTDDAYRQEQTGWWIWNGDAIQFGFARKRLERLSANDYTDVLEQGTTEVNFALTRNGPEAYRTVSFDPYRLPTDMHGKGQIDLAECPVVIEKEDLGGGRVALRYRIAFPWRFMNKTEGAKAGDVVYFAATFNDRDPGDKAYSALRLFELKKVPPRHFGNIVLAP